LIGMMSCPLAWWSSSKFTSLRSPVRLCIFQKGKHLAQLVYGIWRDAFCNLVYLSHLSKLHISQLADPDGLGVNSISKPSPAGTAEFQACPN
jgi:hypothetical protein